MAKYTERQLNILRLNHNRNTYRTDVVGVTFDGRQEVVRRLRKGDSVMLVREPDNPFDTNAIRVERMNGEQFGYLNRQLAAQVAPRFDTYGKPMPGCITFITGIPSPGYIRGAVVQFTIPDVEPS